MLFLVVCKRTNCFSHGDYDIPFEESYYVKKKLLAGNSRLSNELTQPQVDSALDRLKINEQVNKFTNCDSCFT